MNKKFENIQALRAIAVLLVVAFHLTGVEHKYFQGNYVLNNFLDIGNAGVDLFFVISGFVMVVVTHNQFQNSSAIKNFLYHRISRIYPIYWLFTLFLLSIHFVFPHAVSQLPDQQSYIWKSLFLIPQNQLPLITLGWTLIHEMYFYLIFTLFLFFPEKYFIKLLGIWSLLIVIGNILLHHYPSFSSPAILLITHPLTFEFIAGCIIAKLYYAGVSAKSDIFFWLAIILLVISFEFFSHFGSGIIANIENGVTRVLMFGIASALLVYAVVGFESCGVLFPKVLRSIGDSSYSIYLSHIFILSTLGRIYSKMPWHNVFIHIAFIITAILVVIMLGKYSYVYLEQPIIRASRKWRNSIILSHAGKKLT